MPDIKVRRRKVTDYIPDPHNANEGTERGLRMLDDSLQTVGAGRSIVAANDDSIPAGNKTLERAADLGIEDVIEVETTGDALVVVKRSDWESADDPDARKYAYLDNRVAEIDLSWNPSVIFQDQEDGFDFSDIFRDDELAEIVAGANGGEGEAPDAEDPDADDFGEIRPKRGDVWLIASQSLPGKFHRVMCGDSTDAGDVARVMGGEKADAVVTDPPYGEINAKWDRRNEWWVAIDDAVTQIGYLVFFCSLKYLLWACPQIEAQGFEFRWDGAWHKTNGFAVSKKMPLRAHENVVVFIRDGVAVKDLYFEPYSGETLDPWTVINNSLPEQMSKKFDVTSIKTQGGISKGREDGRRWLTTSWQETNSRGNSFALGAESHPTQKPANVVGFLLEAMCPDKGLAFDPFLGSGTTLIAAEQLGRLCYGVDIEPRYVEVTLRRAEAMDLTVSLEAVHA